MALGGLGHISGTADLNYFVGYFFTEFSAWFKWFNIFYINLENVFIRNYFRLSGAYMTRFRDFMVNRMAQKNNDANDLDSAKLFWGFYPGGGSIKQI